MALEKNHLTIGLLGQEGKGKTTLLAAISQTLSQKYGLSEPVSFRELDTPDRVFYNGVSIKMAQAVCASPERINTFIDFPSHKDAVKAMIVSEVKMDGAILVVSADTGVMLQTREHLDLARKLDVPNLLVFLSRCDLVDDEELLDLVEMEIQETLDEYGFDGDNTEIIRGSALHSMDPELYDPACIEALMDAIDNRFYLPAPAADKPLLMDVEEFLSLAYRGVVARGKVQRGTVRVGDTLELVGFEPTRQVKAAAIDAYGKVLDTAGPGAKVGILLSGVTRDTVSPGQVLALPGTIKAGKEFGAEIYVNTGEEGNTNKPLLNGTSVVVSLRTVNVHGVITFNDGTASIKPGNHASARIEIEQPLALEEGMRFALFQAKQFVEGWHRVAEGIICGLPDSVRTDPRKRSASSLAAGSFSAAAHKGGNAAFAAKRAPDPEKGISASDCYDRGERAWKDKDYETAVFWYTRAAEQGHASAQHDLGFCYQRGTGVTQDPEKAVYWYAKAAEQGLAIALSRLGDCYDEGIGVAQDPETAVHWYRKAAEQGNTTAQCNLGYCYENEYGVAKDPEKAVFWYTKAAEQGDAEAQCRLGYFYDNGLFVARDGEAAVFWYERAAEENPDDAAYILGEIYEKGRGVAKDTEKAIYWYRIAADLGDEEAEERLEELT